MKNIFYFTILLSLSFSILNAQQVPNSSLYNINPYSLNSAYAGFNGGTEAYLSHRSQWTGIKSAPKTIFLSIHSALPKNIGIGGNITYDKTDIISRFSGVLSYSYRIKFKQENHSLGFGISAGIHQIRITPSNAIVKDETDVIVANGNQSGIAFNNEFSVFYSVKKFDFGISIPQIFEAKTNYDLLNSDGSFRFKRHYIGYAAYNFKMGQKFSMQPSVVYKTYDFNQHQVDINTQITYNNLIHLGVGYRTNSTIIGRFGINIKDLFQVAYAYDANFKNIGSYSNGSHEIMIGFKFKKKKITPPQIVEEKDDVVFLTDSIFTESNEKETNENKQDLEETIIEIQNDTIKEANDDIIIKKEPIDSSVFEIHVVFPLGSKQVDENFDAELNKIAEELKNHPDIKVIVIGHSCDIGSPNAIKKIALQRAEMVKTILIEKGVPTKNIYTINKADKEPLVPNTSEENRKQNRRVEFRLNAK